MSELKNEWVENTIADRMKDRDWIIDAIVSKICDNPGTQRRMAALILGNGNINELIDCLKMDCFKWIQERTLEETGSEVA